MSEIGSQSPSAINESSYLDSSYDDSSIFDRDDSLRENDTLSGDTRHQFSVIKRSNANSVTTPSANSTNQTSKACNIIQLKTSCEGSSKCIVPRNTNYFLTRSGGK